ncbi:helicase-associated domain-containing protein [Streptomyces sp. P1-3]|uniref:helicase-associated domain-containing protein n=1 Tax=Streptomyces sp. P1-3 TaxID=3421658 RepID=UPI003D36D230
MTTSRTSGTPRTPGNGNGRGGGRPSGRSGGRAGGRTGGSAPRTLAEELRTRPDSALAILLRARPDLLSPVPNDLTQLATRAGTRASVIRAVERLDRFTLQTAEALAVAPDPCPYATLHALMTGDAGDGTEHHPVPDRDTDRDTGRDTDAAGGTAAPRGTITAQDTDRDTTAPADSAAARDTTAARDAAGTAPLPAATVAAVSAELPRAVAILRAQALVWGGDDRLRLIRTARELLAPSAGSPSPTGLGPTLAEATAGMSPGRLQETLAAAGLPATHDPVTAVAALTSLFEDRTRMAALLAEAPPGALAVLARLTWGPPYGEVSVSSPTPPVEWLMARGLLLPSGPRHVVLPREAALHLRAGRAHRAPEPLPPPVTPSTEHRPQAVDATAAGQAYTALATVEELLKRWESGGPLVLRAGGLSVRDLKRTATALDVTDPEAAFWTELAYAAGLLASDGDADERFAPTPEYDDWLRLPAEERWTALATAWLAATRTAGLVGHRDAKGRTLSALGPDLDRSPAPEVRRRALELVAALPPGTAATPDALLTRLRWERPLRGAGGARTATGTASGGASGRGRTATAGGAGGAVDAASAAARPGVRGAYAAPAAPESATTESAASTGRTGRVAGITAAEPTTTAATAERAGSPEPEDLRSRLARWALTEAELLGVTGRGALSSHGRALLGPLREDPYASAHGLAAGQVAAVGPADRGAVSGTASPGPAGHGVPAGPTRGAEAQAEAHAQAGAHAEADAITAAAEAAVAATAAATGLSPAAAAAAAAHAARLLAPLLPEPLDHVLLQADLTAVAPGPLRRPLAEALGVLAEVESKGGATVYRFTPGSVRRALDAGRSAADLHAFLAEHSRTPVPQPLSYLIDDVARRHGHLRIGAASAYLRCDDDALLAEILADRRSAPLRLRRLAPTVLAAQAAPDALLEGLRAMGYAPAAESAEGDVLVTRADAHRTPPRTAPVPVPDGPPVPDDTLLGAAVRAIRAGDLAATAPHKPVPAPSPGAARAAAQASGDLPRTSAADTLATMQAAALTGTAVWIGYVNADGAASQRVIAPIRVEGGFVTAYDHTADEVRTYPLHRVTGAAELADEAT